MLPDLSVVIPTKNRHKIVQETVWRLNENLRYNGNIYYFVGVDGDPLPLDWFSVPVTVIIAPNRGHGANLNLIHSYVTSPLILQLDDDMHLLHPLDVTKFAHKLLTDDTAGDIRLYGVGGHQYVASLDREGYWRIKWEESFELHIPSMRPHIKHRRFMEHYGRYPEDLKVGETEAGWGHICKDTHRERGGPDVLVPLYPVPDEWWFHADEGKSIRESELV